MTIAKTEDIKPVIEKAINLNGPVVIDCKISPDANVLPMIPPGKTVNEIVTEM
jgi:acetolactate synthase-1/2/3 large subunit